MSTNIEVKPSGSNLLVEYTSDPVSPSNGQQWLLKGSRATLGQGNLMMGIVGIMAKRQEAILLKIKTSLGVKSILLQ